VDDRAGQTVIVGQVYAVDDQPAVVGVAVEQLPGVGRSLGNMHVYAGAVVSPKLGGRGDRVGFTGERRVEANPTTATLSQNASAITVSDPSMAFGDSW